MESEEKKPTDDGVLEPSDLNEPNKDVETKISEQDGTSSSIKLDEKKDGTYEITEQRTLESETVEQSKSYLNEQKFNDEFEGKPSTSKTDHEHSNWSSLSERSIEGLNGDDGNDLENEEEDHKGAAVTPLSFRDSYDSNIRDPSPYVLRNHMEEIQRREELFQSAAAQKMMDTLFGRVMDNVQSANEIRSRGPQLQEERINVLLQRVSDYESRLKKINRHLRESQREKRYLLERVDELEKRVIEKLKTDLAERIASSRIPSEYDIALSESLNKYLREHEEKTKQIGEMELKNRAMERAMNNAEDILNKSPWFQDGIIELQKEPEKRLRFQKYRRAVTFKKEEPADKISEAEKSFDIIRDYEEERDSSLTVLDHILKKKEEAIPVSLTDLSEIASEELSIVEIEHENSSNISTERESQSNISIENENSSHTHIGKENSSDVPIEIGSSSDGKREKENSGDEHIGQESSSDVNRREENSSDVRIEQGSSSDVNRGEENSSDAPIELGSSSDKTKGEEKSSEVDVEIGSSNDVNRGEENSSDEKQKSSK